MSNDLFAGIGVVPGTFLLPALNKADFFPAIEQLGILPRKTFSMGHAHDKRFYIECRKIL